MRSLRPRARGSMNSNASTPGALRLRFSPLIWLGVLFVGIAFLIRLMLLVKTGADVPHEPLKWLYIFGVGLAYDLLTFVYFAWPMVLFLWLMPRRAYLSGPGRTVFMVLCFVLLYALLFIGASELIFWNEFGARFNFIAVDYLVYTHEVVGNIQESYPVVRWILMLFVLGVVVFALTRRFVRPRDSGSTFVGRTAVAFVWLLLTVAGTWAIDASMKDRSENNYVNELAGDGIYQFFAAFRNNELDYAKYYKSMPTDDAFRVMREQLQTPDARFVSSDPRDLTRVITNPGPEKHLNVVLITVESLSGEYMKSLGNTQDNITPNLDALAEKSLFFTQMYATGTRTVRGLEALTLSVPPTPGESIIKRPDNENLFSLADVFNERGYESEFIYGGYGYFDNMNYFFDHNGYKSVDRTVIKKEDIHSENVWGVADEDLFTLVMQQADKAYAQNKPIFAQVMTTSNHRPFTFPEGRVDMPQHVRRAAVKYTDWAIADFLKRAATKPWFADTVFVIIADHCATSAGKTSLPVERYHIPLIIYSPKYIQPAKIDRVLSQIDVPPTLLGLLNFSYTSRFLGYDLFRLEPGRERAFISTYQELGYMHGNRLTSLIPRAAPKQVTADFNTGDTKPVAQVDQADVNAAIGYYQIASYMFSNGLMKYRVAGGEVAPK
jgi:phosphoglycerol transferase MdoB-like AlkP superfamily enzyme